MMSSASEKTDAEKRELLLKIVKGNRTAFFVTETAGDLHGRPMSNAAVEDDLKAVWFATRRDSTLISEIRDDKKVILGYTNSTGSEWASVSGKASLVADQAKIKELWSPIWKNWFEGPDDPNILLIRVTPTSAEYWDSGSAAFTMIKLVLSAVTGKHFNEGEHDEVKV